MTDKRASDHFRSVKELFDDLYDRSKEEQRAILEKRRAQDPAIVAEVEELLPEEDTIPGEVLGETGWDIPDRIGPFVIRSLIGEGGMGVVYHAEQEGPIRRKVALKLIRKGMDSRAILARFDSERQALAIMDHPNIARVYDAGATKDGRPYFAMEYVHGVPLTDYCDQYNLSLKDRLQLFIEVCHGIQHAHQKAVMHRDLKPSNILVARDEDRPVPKIIDFGLAKALGGRLADLTVFTEQGILVGTPEYMSPEQADPNILDIDTRTDIYSLGVVFYHLLAGALPLEMADLRNEAQLAALEAIRRKICEEEPQRPSTKIESSHETSAETAKKRRLDPGSLIRRLRGDLDWITMKALEKDRTRRYATAMDFVADIERHLNDEPVTAGPPSVLYRLKKFVRKNKAVVVSVGVIILALATGGVTATVFYLKSETALVQKEAALKSESEARKLAQAGKTEAERRREEAERERSRAKAAETGERDQRKKAEVAEQKAERAQSEAERQRDEILRLSDIKKLSELRDEADRLWPSYPTRVEAMEAWLADARKLTGNLDEHRETLVKLREEAVSKPQNGEDGQSDDEKSETLTGWKFADVETQWRHDVLTELVFGLKETVDPDPQVGLIADVGERLVFARRVREETVERYDVEWEEAITSIANEKECPQYNGFEIKPQIGLVPIGKDQESGLWEFGHLQTGEIPDRDEERKLEVTKETGLVFILIPGGKFWMGSQKADENKPNHDPQARGDEGPVHEVTLDPFFLSKYEMTQGQWECFTKENPSDHQSGGIVPKSGLHPVEQVSWDECDRVLTQLGLLLPTEAQWEYAARAGTNTVWWTGDDQKTLDGAANLADKYCKDNGGPSGWFYEEWLDDGFAVHAPIKTYQANPFGLHEILGNVTEWTRDGYTNYSTSVREGDGARFLEGAGNRVSRDGSYNSAASSARSALRRFSAPDSRDRILGCRPSRVVDP